MDLNKLIVPRKEQVVEYPGMPGLKVSLVYLSKQEMIKLRNKATDSRFYKGQQKEEVNNELLNDLYIDAVIRNWEGFKYKYLQHFIPIDSSQIDDMDSELPYTFENARVLMKNSVDFDNWVATQLDDIENFTSESTTD